MTPAISRRILSWRRRCAMPGKLALIVLGVAAIVEGALYGLQLVFA